MTDLTYVQNQDAQDTSLQSFYFAHPVQQAEEFCHYNLLGFIAANSGRIESRSHMQKLCYVLKCVRMPGFADVEFKYDLRGPYSRELSDALHDLVAARLIEEKIASNEGQNAVLTEYQFSYIMLDNVRQLCHNRFGSIDDRIGKLLETLASFPFEALLLSCSVLFLVNEYQRPEQEAFDKLLNANRLLEPFAEDARTLLAHLDSNYCYNEKGFHLRA